MSDRPSPTEREEQAARLAELGLLTASLLHEVRQPLFALKATAELALQHGDDPRWRSALEQVAQIEELVAHYGGVARDDDEVGLFDLREPVSAAVRMLTHRATRADVALDLEGGDGAAWVRGREGAIRQAVLNLVHNAIDAVDGEARREVRVWSGTDGDMAVVRVRDSGPGVPSEVIERVFDPFVTTKPPGRGTGLGLYITRSLVERAGGTVRLAPDEQGTVAELLVPRIVA